MAVASGRRSIWVKDRPAAVGERSHSIDRMKSQQAMRGGMEEKAGELIGSSEFEDRGGLNVHGAYRIRSREREKKNFI